MIYLSLDTTPATSEEHLGLPLQDSSNELNKNHHHTPLSERNSLLPPGLLEPRRKSSDVSGQTDSHTRSFLDLASTRMKSAKSISTSEFCWTDSGTPVPQEVVEGMQKFLTKQPSGTIDVWWLFDDGGAFRFLFQNPVVTLSETLLLNLYL